MHAITLKKSGRLLRDAVLTGVLLFGWTLSPGLAAAPRPSIGIVYSGDSSTQKLVVDEIAAEIAESQRRKDQQTDYVLYETDQLPSGETKHSLWITVGLKAAILSEALTASSPVLHCLLPRSSLEALITETGNEQRMVAGIHLDQPPYRLLNLLSLAMPGRREIGIVLGPSSASARSALEQHARTLGLNLHIQQISDQTELIDALERVLQRSQILLALPDPLVYNRFTVQKILLTTYRRRIPVVAFSAALARAGATLAVYSSPQQIGRHVGEEALRIVTNPNDRASSMHAPQYYAVSVNQQVARSLGLNIPEQEELYRALSERER